MEHSYLFESRPWKAEGLYYTSEGESFPLWGEVLITRSGSLWTLRGFMEIDFPQPARFTNDYCISPGDNPLTLDWESLNPDLGTLRGTFEIIGPAIISFYRSSDGVYGGAETLIKREEGYETFGAAFKNSKKMSSWAAQLS